MRRDYKGLHSLLRETRAAFEPSGRVVTLAYYPDGRQEKLLAQGARSRPSTRSRIHPRHRPTFS